ncbi:MAG: T9SS type A sorting domain-containing protein [Ignavibacteria bacterium]|nr:T9SS type A sorting domain-containing protein [Ignavibacteria bacterium]
MCANNSPRYFYLIINFLLLIAVSIYAQPTEQWASRYNSPANSTDNAKYMTVDNSGNVIVTGVSAGGNDLTTVKYSPTGAEMWASTHSTTGADFPCGIAADNSGNIIIGGTDFQANYNWVIIKYNSAGNIQWIQHHNGAANRHDYAQAMICDANGNIYISGSVEKSTTGTFELVTIKYNSSGVFQWTNRTDVVYPYVFDMKLDPSGNVYLCGALSSTNTNAFLAKVSNGGTLLFLQTYDNTPFAAEDSFYSLGMNNSGSEIFVTGRSWGGNTLKFDCVTAKYNSSGVSQWVQRYNGLGSGDDRGFSLVIDNSGNVYSAGESYGGVSAGRDIAIAKYSSSGTPLGFQRYTLGDEDEGAYKIRMDASQNFYLAGFSNSDILVLKYNNALTLQWIKKYNGPANDDDGPSDMMLDNTGNIYVTGTSKGIGTNYDYVTIKYSQTVGLNQISTDIPTEYSLSQNYPNPFNPSTTIKFDIPNEANVKITVYDMLGKEVKVLADEFTQAGSYEVNFDASMLSSGTYFYKLTADSFNDIKKMVLVK